jgi:CBS-domain-containing membrane protein
MDVTTDGVTVCTICLLISSPVTMLSSFDAMVTGVLVKRSVRKMIEEFRLYWKHYVLQSLFATLAVFVVLYFLTLQDAVIIASIGASAFIVFAMPKALTANARNVIGGHLVGLFWGALFSLVPHVTMIGSIVCYSLAVGLSIFTMVVTDTEHPPASGTALGVAITGMSPHVLVAVVLSIVLLSLIHHFFKPYLRDLT